jgi:hypothetical protein
MVVRDNASAPPQSRPAKPKGADCCFSAVPAQHLISSTVTRIVAIHVAIAILKLYIFCGVSTNKISSFPGSQRSGRLPLIHLKRSSISQLSPSNNAIITLRLSNIRLYHLSINVAWCIPPGGGSHEISCIELNNIPQLDGSIERVDTP